MHRAVYLRVLAGIVLLALAVRFVAIGSRVHVDDAYSWLVASAPSPHAFLSRLAANENTPPLFYLLLTPLPIDQPEWLRVPAAVAGALMCVVLYYGLRRPFGVGVASLAALAVAVSPFLVTYSDLGRGFMLEDLALLVVLWATLRLAERETRRWWVVLVLAGIVAIYTEYDSAIFLVAATLAVLWIGRPRPWRMALATAVPFVALIPWIPQMIRAQGQVGVTKLSPMFGTTSLRALRDVTVTLALGENGGTSSSAGRWLEFMVLLGGGVAAVIVIRQSWNSREERQRRAIRLLVAIAGLAVLGHATAGAVGVQVFTQRYMTIMIPLVAALAAVAIVSVGWRPLVVTATGALVALGLVNLARRNHGQYEPDFTPVRAAALAYHPRAVLTNTPIVLYYLRTLRPQFDRPSNLGRGRQQRCLRPCLIIDDSRVYGGIPRQAGGTRTVIGPYDLTLEP